jgi:WD40 repeat protein
MNRLMTPGTRLGPYEIVGTIGAGGMGEVYRARDSRLGRDVAIKVSAEHFSDRFEREARAIAALNHPHICTLHDVGPNYLVMELVEGPTLADRIARGPIAVDETLRIARQMADALATAHDKGIVHRDLKPANVKLTPSGAVKILDFGLAQQTDAGSLDRADDSPTRLAQTRAGVILGTISYMSPEQARGLAVDKRADVWAFGVILFEMLTGARPFEGATVSDTLAAVLTREPDWSRIPAAMRPLVQRCLTADPSRRLRDLGDIDLLLERAPSSGPARRSWLAWGAAALLLATLGPVAYLHLRERPRLPETMRFQIPATVNLAASGNVGLSPDGRYLAFLSVGLDGLMRLSIRGMDSLDVRTLQGSEVAGYGPPFWWSPDSRFIAFDAGGKLKKLSVAGGPPQTLCDLKGPVIGGSWNRDGDIILGMVGTGIARISAAGGSLSPVTSLAQKDHSHLLPTFLPDGRHFVYLRISAMGAAPDAGGVYIGTLDAKPEEQSPQQLLPYARGLTYAPSNDEGAGRLLFVREGTLLAQPFDHQRLRLAGEATPVAEPVGAYLDTAFFSASFNNVLVYRGANPPGPIGWFDRQGNMIERVFEPGHYGSAALSRDGTRVVASRTDPRDWANSDLWVLDLSRGGSPARFTFGSSAGAPIWSADGTRIAFSASGPGGVGIYQKSATSAQEPVALQSNNAGISTASSWSPDGRYLMYSLTSSTTGLDLMVLETSGASSNTTGKPVPFLRTRYHEDQGHFSPDGQWVAYVSNETGPSEVYVRRFTTDFSRASQSEGGGVLVSQGGGTAPRWRGDGKELFYLASNDRMMAVGLNLTGTDAGHETPRTLFQAPPGVIVGDVSADGKRFLLLQRTAAPFTVLLNWMRN